MRAKIWNLCLEKLVACVTKDIKNNIKMRDWFNKKSSKF